MPRVVSVRLLLTSVAAGAGAGLVILGIGGRLLMRALVLLRGGTPGVSLGGSAEVVLVGVLYGAVGGLLLPLCRRFLAAARVPAGVPLGLLLLGLGWLTSPAGRNAAAGLGSQLAVAIGIAAVAFASYGLAAEWLFVRWSRPGSGGRRPTSDSG